MANAMNYALRARVPAVTAVAAQFVNDVSRGLLATSRLLVTAVGCATLFSVAVVLSNAGLRERVFDHVTPILASFTVHNLVAVVPEAEAVEPTAVAPSVPSVNDPQQRHVTQYLSRRYRVAEEAVRRLVAAAHEAGSERQIDPLLVLAVMAVESSMNPFAESPVGAQGLMQVMTRVHADKFEPHGGGHAALDPIANIKVGTAILQDLVRRGGSVERGLQLYVGAGNLPDDGGYAARVLGERSRIAIAASGKVDSALAAAWRADAARAAALNRPVGEGAKPQGDGNDAAGGTTSSADRAV